MFVQCTCTSLVGTRIRYFLWLICLSEGLGEEVADGDVVFRQIPVSLPGISLDGGHITASHLQMQMQSQQHQQQLQQQSHHQMQNHQSSGQGGQGGQNNASSQRDDKVNIESRG